MKNKNSIIVILLAVFFIGSCKKYEDNPAINLFPKNYRLTVGDNYETVTFLVNGVDSINQLFNKNDITFRQIEGENVITNGFIRGKWSFDDHKKYLKIDMENSSAYHYGNGPFVTDQPLDWRITKLTDRELHLKAGFNGKNYVLELHRK